MSIVKGAIPVHFKKGDSFAFINDPVAIRTVQNVTVENRIPMYNFGPIAEGDADFRLTQREVNMNINRTAYDDAVARHTVVYP